jgi:hypothetical protein
MTLLLVLNRTSHLPSGAMSGTATGSLGLASGVGHVEFKITVQAQSGKAAGRRCPVDGRLWGGSGADRAAASKRTGPSRDLLAGVFRQTEDLVGEDLVRVPDQCRVGLEDLAEAARVPKPLLCDLREGVPSLHHVDA